MIEIVLSLAQSLTLESLSPILSHKINLEILQSRKKHVHPPPYFTDIGPFFLLQAPNLPVLECHLHLLVLSWYHMLNLSRGRTSLFLPLKISIRLPMMYLWLHLQFKESLRREVSKRDDQQRRSAAGRHYFFWLFIFSTVCWPYSIVNPRNSSSCKPFLLWVSSSLPLYPASLKPQSWKSLHKFKAQGKSVQLRFNLLSPDP